MIGRIGAEMINFAKVERMGEVVEIGGEQKFPIYLDSGKIQFINVESMEQDVFIKAWGDAVGVLETK